MKSAAEDVGRERSSVGEHSSRRGRCGVSRVGASGKANVGMSNDKGGVNPPRRKAKDS